jgi:hypothetical protein
MSRKFICIIIFIFILSSCDLFLSFLVSPVYNIPVFRAAWTVDAANNKIIGDQKYFSDNNNAIEWTLNWDGTILKSGEMNSEYRVILNGLPKEILNYNYVDSPLFYLNLLFKDTAGPGVDVTATGSILNESIIIGFENDTDISVNYDRDWTFLSTSSYTLPEPAYLGIDGTGLTTVLTGGLNIIDIDITANHDFVTGRAICVFSNTDPAGLLYMVYYHSDGLVSLIYAHDVKRTGALNYLPDGYYEYIWSVYKK